MTMSHHGLSIDVKLFDEHWKQAAEVAQNWEFVDLVSLEQYGTLEKDQHKIGKWV